MRALVQKVRDARLHINEAPAASMGPGLVVLLGIETEDGIRDIQWLSGKISRLRVFDDVNGVMNLSVMDQDADVMVISQFTLHASTKKGNRPSYIRAAPPDIAIPLYEAFITQLETDLGKKVFRGEFGAYMQVNLTNDGPVTLMIDTKNKE